MVNKFYLIVINLKKKYWETGIAKYNEGTNLFLPLHRNLKIKSKTQGVNPYTLIDIRRNSKKKNGEGLEVKVIKYIYLSDNKMSSFQRKCLLHPHFFRKRKKIR